MKTSTEVQVDEEAVEAAARSVPGCYDDRLGVEQSEFWYPTQSGIPSWPITFNNNGTTTCIGVGAIPYGTAFGQRQTPDVRWTRFQFQMGGNNPNWFPQTNGWTAPLCPSAQAMDGVVLLLSFHWIRYAFAGNGAPIRELVWGGSPITFYPALPVVPDPNVVHLLTWRMRIYNRFQILAPADETLVNIHPDDKKERWGIFDIPLPPEPITRFRAGTGSTSVIEGYLAISARFENKSFSLSVMPDVLLYCSIKMSYKKNGN